MFSIFDGPDAQCVLLSASQTLIAALENVLYENKALLYVVSDYSNLKHILHTRPDLNYIMIDIDTFDGIGPQFRQLLSVRNDYPQKNLILMSEEFQTDEFGTHRLMLGDISLRLPILHASLELALLQAPANNTEWRKRVSEQPIQS
jgi:hypothetical protein